MLSAFRLGLQGGRLWRKVISVRITIALIVLNV